MEQPIPALDTPPPQRPPEPPRSSANHILHVLSAVFSGVVLIHAMWIDDYVSIVVMALAVFCNGYLLWDVMRDRQ